MGSVKYRLGQLNSDGTIAWVTSEQTAASENGTQLERHNLRVDKQGYPWVIYNRLNTTDDTRGCYVSKSQWNNGSWSTAPNFPYKMSALLTYAYRGMLLELDEGMYALWYIYDDELRGRLWNYTSQGWENEEVGADGIDPKRLNAAVTTSDNTIHMIIAPHGLGTSTIYYMNRTSAGFGSPVPIDVLDTAPPYKGESITADGNDLYLFWRNTTTTIISMNRTNGIWGEKFVWKNNERGTRSTGIQSFSESADNKIGVAWIRGTSRPYNLVYGVIDLASKVPPIFSDDVEGGDFGRWDAVIGAPQVTSGDAYNGSYKAVFDSQGARVRKDFAATSPLYFRFYFRIGALPQSPEDKVMLGSMGKLGNGWVQRIYLYNNGTDVVWRMGYYDSGGYSYINSGQQANPSVDTWISVEIKAKSGGNGEFRVWIDGSELTDFHLTGMGVDRDINFVLAGTQIFSYTTVVYEDSFVVHNSYIGQFIGMRVRGQASYGERLLGEVEDIALNFASQRKVFYAQGRHWVFYKNGTNIALRTSSDDLIFSGEIIVANMDEDSVLMSTNFAIWNNETHVAYVSAYLDSIKYRLGQLNSDGTITWVTSEQTAASENGTQLQRPNLRVDKHGYPWIIYNRLNTTDNTRGSYVSKSQWNNGSWSTAPNFPYKMSALLTYAYRGMLLELDEGMYALWYIYDDELRGRLWNYTSQGWENEEVGADGIDPKRLNAAVTTSDNTIHMIIAPHGLGTSTIYYMNRTSAGFGSPVPIDVLDTAPPYKGESITADGNDLYLFWRNTTTTIISMNRTNGIWGEKFVWKNNERGTRSTGIQSFSESADNKIGVAWIRGTSRPYNLVYGVIDLASKVPPIFSDDVEGGDFGRWDAVIGAPQVTSGDAYNGSYKAVFDSQGARVRKDFAATSPLYFRFYFRIDALPPNLGDEVMLGSMGELGNGWVQRIYLYNNGTDVVWRMGYYDSWGRSYINSGQQANPNVDTWICVEIKAKSGGNGEFQVWIDGSELTDLHLTNKKVSRDINFVLAGTQILSYTVVVYEDSFVVHNSYIGRFNGIPDEVPPVPPIFMDDVEGGDFGRWDAVIGAPQVTSGDAYNGSYKAVFDSQGARVRKDYTAVDTIYSRFYVRLNAVPSNVGETVMLGAIGKVGASWKMRIFLYHDGTDVVWRMGYRPGGTQKYKSSTQQKNPSIDTWYSVEMMVKNGLGTARWRLWVDGTELTDLDTSGIITESLNFLLVGSQVLNYTAELWVDSVVIDTSYIGPRGRAYFSFGKTDIGGSGTSSSNPRILGSKFALTEDGILTKITAFVKSSSSTDNVQCGIYDSSYNLKGTTNEASVGTSFSWVDFSFASPLSLTSGDYFITIGHDTRLYFKYDPGSTDQTEYRGWTYGIWPDPAGFDSSQDWEMSIYATYTISG